MFECSWLETDKKGYVNFLGQLGCQLAYVR